MTFDQDELTNDLVARCENGLARVAKMKAASVEALNFKLDDTSWSVLECIEHLNRYGRFYLPEIKRRMEAGKNHRSTGQFKSGALGNYFAESMLPKEKLNTMKTFKSMNPNNSSLGMEGLDEFEVQLNEMIVLLKQSRALNIQKIKTSITISKLLKLRLGDTFRVVIYHNDRHLEQAEKALQNFNGQAS